MKKLLIALSVLCCTAFSALAQNAITLPIAANAVADIGNGPIKVRMIAGNASIFTAQSSGVGSTSGSSTALTLTATPATPPLVGGLISGSGITSGTTITAYNGTTGITLSAAMTVPGGTTVSWGAACPSSAAGIPASYIQASAMADYYIMYTQARVCAVSPGGPVNTLLIAPIFQEIAPGFLPILTVDVPLFYSAGVLGLNTTSNFQFNGSGQLDLRNLQPGQVLGNNGGSPAPAAPIGPNITWPGDQYFASGRPWCDPRAYGALGNNSNDDAQAILECAAAVNSESGANGGVVNLTTGFYRVVSQGLNFDANAITAATWSGGTITLTTARNHGILPGELFLLSGMAPSGYNTQYFTAIVGTAGNTLVATTNLGQPTVLGKIPAIPIQFVGANQAAAEIINGGFAGQTVTFNANYSGIDGVTVQGYNSVAATSSSYASIYYGISCGDCFWRNGLAQYGAGVWFAGTDGYFANISAKYSYYPGALTNIGTGLRLYSPALDNGPPGLALSQGISLPSAWQASHSYTAGNIVTLSGFVLEAMTSGTSAGSAPTVLPYLQNISDSGVTWQLFEPVNSSGLECDAGGVIGIYAPDMSGNYYYNLWIDGCANVTIHGGSLARALDANILAAIGETVNITDALVQECVTTGCQQISIGSGWTGEFHAKSDFVNGTSSNTYGIYNCGGTNNSFTDVNVTENLYGFFICPNVSKFQILGGQAGQSNVYGNTAVGVNVASGTSDDYEIIGVNCRDATSACISDGGSGTHKTVFGNNGSAGTIAGAFSWLGTLTFADSGTWGSGGINGSNIGTTTPSPGKFTTLNYTSALQHNGTAVQCSDLSNAGALCPVTPGTGVAAALGNAANTSGGIQTESRSLISGGSASGTLTSNNTVYQCTFNQATGQAIGCTFPFSGTARNLYFNTTNGPGVGQQVTLTLVIGAYGSMSATTLTCQLAGAGTGANVNSCSDTNPAHAVTFTAGQSFALQEVTSNGATTSTGVSFAFEVDNP